MGLKLKREKKTTFLVKLIYGINKLLPLSKKAKFKLYLDMEWMFDRLSHEYSFKNYQPNNHPVRKHTRKTILDFITADQSILDLGCNRGDMSIYIADKAKLVVGVDYDEFAINLAKEKYQKENLEFICADAYDYLNKTEKSFDTLILSHILEHLDDPESFLNKYTPFFKYLYIELPDFDKTLLNQYRLDNKMSLIYMDADHISEFDRYDLKALLEKCKLEIIQAEYIFGLQKIWCKVIK